MMDKVTEALMRSTAEETAERTVNRAFLMLGIDPGDPLEAQRNMLALRELRVLVEDEEFQADMSAVRRWRKTMEAVEGRGIVVGVGLLCVGGAALLFYALGLRPSL